jgi:hypothetical protein
MCFCEAVGGLSVGKVAREVQGVDEGVARCASVGSSNGLGIRPTGGDATSPRTARAGAD